MGLEDDEEEKETLITPYHALTSPRRSRRRRFELFFMTFGGVSLFLLIALFAAHTSGIARLPSSFEAGWKTEVGPPYPKLSVERIRFTAGLDLDEHGDIMRTGSAEGAPQFVGKPSREIDANWDYLIPSDTNITRGEAEQIGGKFHFFPGTNIASIEISTFHVLHCVDQVRRGVHAKHYYPKGINQLEEVHLDHCIDVIRQYIQCHLDLTPINLVWSPTKRGVLPDFTQFHTCRSWEQAHKWVLHRNIANYEQGIGSEEVAIDARNTLRHFGWA